MLNSRVRLSVAEARPHAEMGLAGIGYDAEDSRTLADHMLDAALCGYEYSGLAKILIIPEHRRFKQPRRPISVLRETEVSVLTTAATMSACWRCTTPPAPRSAKPKPTVSRSWA
jgi:hypothetical protein